MSFDYTATAATALRLLQRFGAAATLKRTSAAAYDPATGTSAETVTSLDTTAALFSYEQKYIDGSLILQGDFYALLSASPVPKQGDVLNARDPATGDLRDFTVVTTKPTGPAGVPVLHEAQVRG